MLKRWKALLILSFLAMQCSCCIIIPLSVRPVQAMLSSHQAVTASLPGNSLFARVPADHTGYTGLACQVRGPGQ